VQKNRHALKNQVAVDKADRCSTSRVGAGVKHGKKTKGKKTGEKSAKSFLEIEKGPKLEVSRSDQAHDLWPKFRGHLNGHKGFSGGVLKYRQTVHATTQSWA